MINKNIKRDWKLPNPSHSHTQAFYNVFYMFLNLFYPKMELKVAIFKRSKMSKLKQSKNGKFEVKNNKKRLEIAKFIPFHIHKYCTMYFTGFIQFLNLFCPKNGNYDAVKKWQL